MTSLESLGTDRSRMGHGQPGCGTAEADLALHRVTLELSLAETRGCASLAIMRRPLAAHDATRLVAALEEIEARRAAMQWLLEADLLSLCLV